MTPHEVADKLTEAQRALILSHDHFAIDDANRKGTAVARTLARKGLVFAQLSPEGVEVRRILQERAND